MRVLVTGANGFIGRHVLKALRDAGHDAIGLDNEWLNLKWYEAVDMAVNITKPIDPIEGLDAVVHLAAMSNPRECDADPSMAFDVNVHGTHQVLRMAFETGVKRVVFASTAHVYGISPKYLPTDETHPLWLQNNYTLTKILGEQLCQLYYENHGLSFAALRLYNAFGPDQAKGYFIPDMLYKASKGGIVLPGGNTTKDFVYVEEVARAFVAAVESSYVGHINIGSGVETPLSDVASYIAHAMDAEFSTAPVEGATRMWGDITRARAVLGWTPSCSVPSGLERIFQHEGIKVLV